MATLRGEKLSARVLLGQIGDAIVNSRRLGIRFSISKQLRLVQTLAPMFVVVYSCCFCPLLEEVVSGV